MILLLGFIESMEQAELHVDKIISYVLYFYTAVDGLLMLLYIVFTFLLENFAD